MTNLYLTADQIGTPTGGGLVTAQELMALRSLGGEVQVISRKELTSRANNVPEPWCWDNAACHYCMTDYREEWPRLVHVYSGTFSGTVDILQHQGAKVVYTIAAHSIETSRREHEKLGIPYAELYPHLCQPDLWKRYSAGYFGADHIVCPSTYSRHTVLDQAWKLNVPCPPITVIPHGCHLPDAVKPLPKQFIVGYMGAYGPDKGVIYLLQAWEQLNYKDAILVLSGRDSTSEYVQQMVRHFGGGNVRLMGWVNSIEEFYNSISLYVQPSATEGFGIEVLEAMAHGRPVICSDGAGAADVVPPWYRSPACDVDVLASKIDEVRQKGGCVGVGYPQWRNEASQFAWDKIRDRYAKLYREVLS